jgi:hypothetical protein
MMQEHYIPPEKIDPETGRLIGGIPPRAPHPDKVYYFAPVVIKAGEVLALDGARTVEGLQAALQRYAGSKSSARGYVLETLKALGSAPLGKDGPTMTVELPFNDVAKCYEVRPAW